MFRLTWLIWWWGIIALGVGVEAQPPVAPAAPPAETEGFRPEGASGETPAAPEPPMTSETLLTEETLTPEAAEELGPPSGEEPSEQAVPSAEIPAPAPETPSPEEAEETLAAEGGTEEQERPLEAVPSVTSEQAKAKAQQVTAQAEAVKAAVRSEQEKARAELAAAQRALEMAEARLPTAPSPEAQALARRRVELARERLRLAQCRVAVSELRLQLADEEQTLAQRRATLAEEREKLAGGQFSVGQVRELFREEQRRRQQIKQRVAWQQTERQLIAEALNAVRSDRAAIEESLRLTEEGALRQFLQQRQHWLTERAAALQEQLSLLERMLALTQQAEQTEAAWEQALDEFLQRHWLWARRRREISLQTLTNLCRDLTRLPAATSAWIVSLPTWLGPVWFGRVSRSRLLLGGGMVVLGGVLFWLLRTWGRRWLRAYRREVTAPPGQLRWEAWLAGTGRAALAAGEWAALGGGLWLGAKTAEAPASLEQFLLRATLILVACRGGCRLATELFAPHRPEHRLLPCADGTARYLTKWTLALLIYNAFFLLSLTLLQAAHYREDVLSLLGVIYQGLLLLLLLLAASRRWLFTELLPALSPRQASLLRGLYRFLLAYLLFLIVMYGLGYANLVNYLLVSTLLSTLVLVGLYPGQHLARAALAWAVSWPDRQEEVLPLEGCPAKILYQALQPLVRGLVFVLGGWILLRCWRVALGYGEIAALLTRPFNPESETPLSLWSFICLGLYLGGAFAVSVLLRRGLKRYVYSRPWFRWDAGVRHGISSGLHYGLLVFGALKGLQAVGLSFSKLTVLSASFGVGLGFGLQDIFKNFISGLIVLFDRPVKIGDYVEVAGKSGQVTHISARRTTIRTPDDLTVIVPNSAFISGNVINWSHGSPLARLHLPVAVKNTTPPERVQEVLLRLASQHPEVVADPAPKVRFTALTSGGFNFELLVWTSSPERQEDLISDLNFAIYQTFAAEGIELK